MPSPTSFYFMGADARRDGKPVPYDFIDYAHQALSPITPRLSSHLFQFSTVPLSLAENQEIYELLDFLTARPRSL